MYDECAGHGLILDWAASDSHGACAADGFRLKVGGCGGLGRIFRLRFETLVGSGFDLNGDCCSSQEEAEREAKQGFPESNLHFKFWLGTEFRATAVFSSTRLKVPTEPRLTRHEIARSMEDYLL
jgi:hypothetical protein